MDKTLNIVFEDAAKSRTTISLDDPKNDLTKESLKQAATDVLAANILTSGKGLKLLRAVEANIVTKTVEKFNVTE